MMTLMRQERSNIQTRILYTSKYINSDFVPISTTVSHSHHIPLFHIKFMPKKKHCKKIINPLPTTFTLYSPIVRTHVHTKNNYKFKWSHVNEEAKYLVSIKCHIVEKPAHLQQQQQLKTVEMLFCIINISINI